MKKTNIQCEYRGLCNPDVTMNIRVHIWNLEDDIH